MSYIFLRIGAEQNGWQQNLQAVKRDELRDILRHPGHQ